MLTYLDYKTAVDRIIELGMRQLTTKAERHELEMLLHAMEKYEDENEGNIYGDKITK